MRHRQTSYCRTKTTLSPHIAHPTKHFSCFHSQDFVSITWREGIPAPRLNGQTPYRNLLIRSWPGFRRGLIHPKTT